MTLKPVIRQWLEYWDKVGPPDAPEVRKVETRRAFYAGVFAALGTLRDTDTDAITQSQGVAHLEAMWQECHEFYRLVLAGKA